MSPQPLANKVLEQLIRAGANLSTYPSGPIFIQVGTRRRFSEETQRFILANPLIPNRTLARALGNEYLGDRVKAVKDRGTVQTIQTHPTPVSYTHLTLPTICSV